MAEAEVEFHGGHAHGHGVHEHDGTTFGMTVAFSVSVIGVILAIVTIGSHRAHTAAVMTRSEANDLWSEFQAKRIRGYVAGATARLVPLVMAGADSAAAKETLEFYNKDVEKYADEAKEMRDKATEKEDETRREELRASRLDTSEGFFELGLVLSSIFFLSKRKLFPYIGAVSAAVGAVFGILSFTV